MKYALAALATLALLAGTLVSVGAVPAGDDAGDGVLLEPADTPNGNAYASIDGSGELRLELSELNPSATTFVDSVFTVTPTGEAADVWVESGSGAVRFYRSEDRTSVSSPNDAVRLSPGESLAVGLRVETGGSSPGEVDFTVHATSPPRSQGAGGAPPGELDRETLTPAPPPTETPQPPPSTEQPPQGGQASPTPTAPGTPTPMDESDQEVGGLPLGPLAVVLLALALLLVPILAYRRLRGGPVVRIEAADDSGLSVSTGSPDPVASRTGGEAVSLDLGATDDWTDASGDEPVELPNVVSVVNAVETPRRLAASVGGGAPEGLRLVSAGDPGTDLLWGPVRLAPGEAVDLGVELPGDADVSGTVTVRLSADPL